GLQKLKKEVTECRERLQAELKAKQKISEEDEVWLDGAGSLVDEECVIQLVRDAVDYEKGLEQLSNGDKDVIKRLTALGDSGAKGPGVASKKHKCLEKKEVDVEKPKKAKMQATPVFTKKENATLAQCIEVLDWYHTNGKNQSKTAKHFELVYPNIMIKQPLISAWVKNEKKWWGDMEHSHDLHNNMKRTHQTQHPEVTEMMDLWILAAMADRINLTGEVLHQKWLTFADMVGIPEEDCLNLSDGWLTQFKARHNLNIRKHAKNLIASNCI
ncbi:hypothetical protein AX14_009760, partial [Amanita brunnescens Koide BX004]